MVINHLLTGMILQVPNCDALTLLLRGFSQSSINQSLGDPPTT